MVDFNGIQETSAVTSAFNALGVDRLRTFIAHYLYVHRFTNNDDEKPFMYGDEPKITTKDSQRHYGVVTNTNGIQLYYKTRLFAKFDWDLKNVILYPFDVRSFRKDDKYDLDSVKNCFAVSAWNNDERIEKFFSISTLYPSFSTMTKIKAKNKKFSFKDKFNDVENIVMNLDHIADTNWFNSVFMQNNKPVFHLNIDKDFIDTVLNYKLPYENIKTKLSFIATHYETVDFCINNQELTFADCKRIFKYFRALTDFDNIVFKFKQCTFKNGTSVFQYDKHKNMDRIVNKLITEQKNMFNGFYYNVIVS